MEKSESVVELGQRIEALERKLRAARTELDYLQANRTVAIRAMGKMRSSRSWRITKSLRSFSKLVGVKPIGRDELLPVTPMRARAGGGHWELIAETGEPKFLVPCVPIKGYVRIAVHITADGASEVHLYYDSGNLFNEAEHLTLGRLAPGKGNEKEGRPFGLKMETVHHLAGDVHCFRLDPMRRAGVFAIEKFEITPLAGIAVDLASLVARYKRARAGGPFKTSVVNCLKMLARGDFAGLRPKWRAVLGAGVVAGTDYQRWRESRALTDEDRERLRREATEMNGGKGGPLISVLMPTYNTPEKLLREAIESVLNQTYPKWELCIADDASTEGHVRRILEEYAQRDSRIRVTIREKNGHIAAATNTALEMARGEYVALLDHDDTLAEHAFSSVAREVVARPELEMVYSDEDKLSEDGRYIDPFFKPDWSPEYFLACMYTCHLGVYRTSRVRQVGGFRSEFDQAQDYDMVLRFVRGLTDKQIGHIPDILYHWRITAASTALNADAKPMAHSKAQAAIRRAMEERGIPATVTDGPAAGFHRVRFGLEGAPRVTVVIPSACREREFVERDGRRVKDYWARRCVASLRNNCTYPDLQIVVIGPENVPEELEGMLRDMNVVRATYAVPFNFSQACNAGARAGNGEYYLFLNDDTEVVTPDFVEEMVSFAQVKEIGAVGAKLLFPNGMLQHIGVTVLNGNPGHPFHQISSDQPGYFYSARVHRNWSAVTAACMMVRRDVFEEVGGFGEDFPLNYNDTDLCLKIRRAGYRIVSTPYAELVHHESVTKPGTFDYEIKMFREKWLEFIPEDPYYNRNLSVTYGDFRVEA